MGIEKYKMFIEVFFVGQNVVARFVFACTTAQCNLPDFNPAFPIEKSVVSDRLGLPYIFYKRFKKLCW